MPYTPTNRVGLKIFTCGSLRHHNEATARASAVRSVIGSERDVVAQAWDRGGIEAAYEAFLDAFSDAAPGTPAEVLTQLDPPRARLAPYPVPRPEAPLELLPDRWAGTRVAVRFDTLHAGWNRQAQQHWQWLVSSAR